MKRYFVLAACLIVAIPVHADTVITKDGEEVKGIVVEDYKDRITLSTPYGETTMLKSDISELYYDSEEDNLIKLAENARDRNDNITAYAYYYKADKLNPGSKRAKDGMTLLQGYLYKRGEDAKEEAVRRKGEFEASGEAIDVLKSEAEAAREAIEKLKASTGMDIAFEGSFPKAAGIRPGSPAYQSGMRKGDAIIAIWARLTGYMSVQDIARDMLERSALEIKCTIARPVDVQVTKSFLPWLQGPSQLIGADLVMEFDGLTVAGVKDGSAAAKAGLAKGDIITAIDGRPTRYMSMKKFIELIRVSAKNMVKLIIHREVTIWKG